MEKRERNCPCAGSVSEGQSQNVCFVTSVVISLVCSDFEGTGLTGMRNRTVLLGAKQSMDAASLFMDFLKSKSIRSAAESHGSAAELYFRDCFSESSDFID